MNPENSKHSSHYKMPEFIDLSKGEYTHHHFEFPSREKESIPDVTQIDVPAYMRFVSFFLSIGMLVWSALNLMAAFCSGLFALALIFKSPPVNRLAQTFWRRCCRFSAIGLGLFTAIFSPQLGLVIIVTHFMMNNENWQTGILGSLLRSHNNL